MRRMNEPRLLAPRRRALRLLALGGVAAALPLDAAWAAGKAGAPRRIVSIGGALTEIVYALGAGDELVGVDTTSTFPETATRLPGVGYARALSSEGIMALAPTLVVATEDAGPPAVLRQIAAAGVPVTVLPSQHRFEGVQERIARLGVLLDRVPQAARLGDTVKADWQRARQPVLARKGRPLRVLFVLSHSPSQIMVGGRGSAAEAMLQYVGAVNAVQGFDGFKPLTPEAVIAAQPDVVLFTTQGLAAIGGIDGALRLPGLAQTPAGQGRRIVGLEAMLLLGFGPRLPAALAALDAALQQAVHA